MKRRLPAAAGAALLLLLAAQSASPSRAEAYAPQPSQWEQYQTPTHKDLLILPGSDIISFDIAGSSGKTIYAIGAWNAPPGCIENSYSDDSISAGQSSSRGHTGRLSCLYRATAAPRPHLPGLSLLSGRSCVSSFTALVPYTTELFERPQAAVRGFRLGLEPSQQPGMPDWAPLFIGFIVVLLLGTLGALSYANRLQRREHDDSTD